MAKIFPFSASFGLAALFVAAALPGFAADAQQNGIQKSYDDQCAALVSGNVATASDVLSSDFIGTEPNNAVTSRESLVASLNMLTSQYRFAGCASRIISLKRDAGKSIVAVERTVEGATILSPVQTVQLISRQNDTWEQIQGNWKLSGTAVMERTLTSNGLIISHEVRPQNR